MSRSYVVVVISAVLAAVASALLAVQVWRQSAAQSEAIKALHSRIGALEAKIEGLSSANAAAPVSTQWPSADSAWPVVARHLSKQMGLGSAQVSALEKAMEECQLGLDKAALNEDPMWRDRLSKRARKTAWTAFAKSLADDQQKQVQSWLLKPECACLQKWFLYEPPGCCGN